MNENNENYNETQAAEPIQEPTQQEPAESHGTEPMLMRKRPNIFWMGGTILFLVAAILVFFMLQSSPIPTPNQLLANMTPAQALSVNAIQLNQEYQQTTSNRGLYEIGAIAIALVMGFMAAKNLYLTVRK